MTTTDHASTAAELVAARREAEEQAAFDAEVALEVERLRAADAEAARVARIAEVLELITEKFGDHEGGVIDAFDEALAANARLLAAVDERNDGFHSIMEELIGLGELPPGLRVNAGAHGDISQGQLHLAREDIFITPIPGGALLAEAALRACLKSPHADDYQGLFTKDAQCQAVYDPDLVKHYGVERGDLVGTSDTIRRVARIVAARKA